MTDPKRYSFGWFLRLPLMASRKLRQRTGNLAPRPGGTLSYAQFGEDIVVASILWYLGIIKPVYLDIGAYAPVALSNTFYFYKRGGRGVCVEPNPVQWKKFRRRRRDRRLNAGVGPEDKPSVPFYVLSEPSLSTFDEDSAREHEAGGRVRIRSIVSVPVYSLNTLIGKYCLRCPDFLSVDVEGLDLEILTAMDFTRYRPAVICVETIDYHTQTKQTAVCDFLQSKGYKVQADTIINTILVDAGAWNARG